MLDRTITPEYKNPYVYNCQHNANIMSCAICNKKYPKNMLTKRSQSQNIIERRNFNKN